MLLYLEVVLLYLEVVRWRVAEIDETKLLLADRPETEAVSRQLQLLRKGLKQILDVACEDCQRRPANVGRLPSPALV